MWTFFIWNRIRHGESYPKFDQNHILWCYSVHTKRHHRAQSRDLMTSSCRWLPLEVIFITSVSSRQSTKSRNKKQQIDREIKTRLICYAHKVQPVLSYDADGFMARNLHLSGARRDLWYCTRDDSLAKMKAFREIVYILM